MVAVNVQVTLVSKGILSSGGVRLLLTQLRAAGLQIDTQRAADSLQPPGIRLLIVGSGSFPNAEAALACATKLTESWHLHDFSLHVPEPAKAAKPQPEPATP